MGRAIDPELAAQRLDGRGVRLALDHPGHHVAGHQPHHPEDDHAHEPERGDGEAETAQDVAPHATATCPAR